MGYGTGDWEGVRAERGQQIERDKLIALDVYPVVGVWKPVDDEEVFIL